VAAVAQWILHGQAMLSPMMVSTSPIFGRPSVAGRGDISMDTLEKHLFEHCRSPLNFLMADLREAKRAHSHGIEARRVLHRPAAGF